MLIELREATIEDIDNLLPLVKQFVTSFEIVESSFRESFVRIQNEPNAIALIAENENELIGYCLGFRHDTFDAQGSIPRQID